MKPRATPRHGSWRPRHHGIARSSISASHASLSKVTYGAGVRGRAQPLPLPGGGGSSSGARHCGAAGGAKQCVPLSGRAPYGFGMDSVYL